MDINNSIIKLVSSLSLKKNRDEEGLFVAEGTKCVRDTWNYFKCRWIISTKTWYEQCGHSGYLDKIMFANKQQMSRMSQFTNPSDVIAVYEIPEDVIDSSQVRENVNIVLDNIQDPGNLGTILRLADWYGIHDVFCSKTTVDIYNHKVVQATMGAISRVHVHYCDLEQLFGEYGDMPVYGTFLDGDNIYASQLPGKCFVIFGNEGQGISAVVASKVNHRLLIPSWPHKGATSESLNVGVAAAITISEFRRGALKSK
jgi:RNA methyltransferase, TrmH family